jgi:hypothetical protein
MKARGYADGQLCLSFPGPDLSVQGVEGDRLQDSAEVDQDRNPDVSQIGTGIFPTSEPRSGTHRDSDPDVNAPPPGEPGGETPRARFFLPSSLILKKKKEESEKWAGIGELALTAFERLYPPPHGFEVNELPEVWIGLVKLAVLAKGLFAGRPGRLLEACDLAHKQWKTGKATKIVYLKGILAKLAGMELPELLKMFDPVIVPNSLRDPPTRTNAEPRSKAEREPKRVTAAEARKALTDVPLVTKGRLLISDVKEENADAS